MSDAIIKTKVYINGIGLPIPQSFNWTHPPGPVDEMVPTIQDEFERPIRVKDNYAEGDFEVIAYCNYYANDPVPMMDVLGFNDRYSYFDTVTETVIHSSETYGWSDEADGSLGMPQVPIELRQTESGVTGDISNGANNMMAFRFKAAGEDIHRLVILCEDVTASEVTSLILQVWSDSSGDPDAVIPSSNTPAISITPSSDAEDYLVLTDLEEGATNDLLDGEELTVGDWYWLVVDANHAEALTIHGTVNSRYSGSDVQVSDDGGSTWSAAANSMENMVFTLQFYHKYGGHSVKVYEYNAGEDKYILNDCQACNVLIDAPAYASQKATRVKIKFKSNYAISSKVTS